MRKLFHTIIFTFLWATLFSSKAVCVGNEVFAKRAIQNHIYAPAPCGDGVAAGTISLDSADYCVNDTVILHLTRNNDAPGSIIKWYRSLDGVTWEQISAGLDTVLRASIPTDSIYYRAGISLTCERFSNTLQVRDNSDIQGVFNRFSNGSVNGFLIGCSYVVLPELTGVNLSDSLIYYNTTQHLVFEPGDTVYRIQGGYFVPKDMNNSCTKGSGAYVLITDYPSANIDASDSALSCKSDSIVLDASASEFDMMYPSYGFHWRSVSGNNSINKTDTVVVINQPDTLELIAFCWTNNGTSYNPVCRDTTEIVITENLVKPEAAIRADTTTFMCRYPDLRLKDSSTVDGVKEIQWFTGDGSITSPITDSIIKISSTGTYNLLVTDTVNGCADTASILIDGALNALYPNIQGVPRIQFTCVSDSVVLDTTGSYLKGNIMFNWGIEDDTLNSGLAATSIIVKNEGEYWLSVVDQDRGCYGSDTVKIETDTVKPTAIITAEDDTIKCYPLLQNIDLRASSSQSNSIYTSGMLTYSWSTGETSAIIEVGSPQEYTLTVTDVYNGCQHDTNITIAINQVPPIVRVDDPSVSLDCNTARVMLDGSRSTGTGSVDYSWIARFGGVIEGETDNNYAYAVEQGEYILLGTNVSNGCEHSDTVFVYDNSEDIGFSIHPTHKVLDCKVKEIMLWSDFSATNPENYTYRWSKYGGDENGLDNDTVVSDSGRYVLEITNNVSHCSNEEFIDISLIDNYPVAPLFIKGDHIVCYNSKDIVYSVDEVSFAESYVWGITEGATIIRNDPPDYIAVDFHSEALYDTIYVYTTNKCGSSDSTILSVEINYPPTQAGPIEGETEICTNTFEEPYNTYVQEGASYYSWWYRGENVELKGYGLDITLDFLEGATDGYIGVLAGNQCGVSPSDSLFISVSSIPDTIVPIIGPMLVCPGDVDIHYEIPQLQEVNGYIWSYSGDDIEIREDGETALLSIGLEATSGYLTVAAINDCGIGTVTEEYFIEVSHILDCAEPIQPANALTPNGDDYHDFWIINGIELFPKAKVEVFDLWGRRVYFRDGGYSNSIVEAWDGTYKGKALPMDNYFYVIDLFSDREHIVKGNVAIIL